jgi:RNA-binding protein
MNGKGGHKAKSRGQLTDPTIFVGRSGVTDAVANEVRDQMRGKSLLKVRFSRDAVEERGREAVAKDLADRSGTDLVEVRGLTALLAKRR